MKYTYFVILHVTSCIFSIQLSTILFEATNFLYDFKGDLDSWLVCWQFFTYTMSKEAHVLWQKIITKRHYKILISKALIL